ncbi:MAG: transglutaminase-like domain-containing protein [Flavobacteriales bacterium]|nr:transglutaminase-like domain-containing protein [Flavobacteriales bacterium]
MKGQKIQALINLLDDPDDRIYGEVKQQFLDIGIEIIPILEEAWENFSYGVIFQNRIEEIIHQIQFQNLCDSFKEWTKAPSSLYDGIILLCKYQYPDLDESRIQTKLEEIRKDIWVELNDNLTALEKVRVMNHIIFEVHKYTANTTNYHAPQNSYLIDVLETRKGNPLTLSCLYILLAEKLNLPIYGVNLPRHFILAYLDPYTLTKNYQLGKRVLFYVNPFNKGSFLSKREIEHFLKQLKVEPSQIFFNPCGNVSIIKRSINNLIYSYEKLGYADKVAELNTLLKLISE